MVRVTASRSTSLSKLRPAAVIAYLAILGRIVVGPLVLLMFVMTSRFLTTATVLIGPDDSYFAFMEMDPVMHGGCTNCNPGCIEVFVKLAYYTNTLLLSKPVYESLYPLEVVNDSILSDAAKELAHQIDATETSTCMSGVDEWGSRVTMVAGTPRQVLDTIAVLGVSVAPQVLKEVENALETVDDCPTRWVLDTHSRVFRFQSTANSLDYSAIPAADLSIFPEYTECRGEVSNDGLVGEKLALETHGTDLVAVVPDLVRLFPYSFRSSLGDVTTKVAAANTMYPATTVTQQMLRAYYGGCRVRVVNTTGVYIEEDCEVDSHWLNYGLMIQTADDLPVCSAQGVCVRNNYNSLWEFVTWINPDTPHRFPIAVNSFRLRYTDKVPLSVLPAVVAAQILFMGWMSLYQTMSHKRSVLLAQIWAYRCQNGRMQVMYLAQISYHLIYNSDLYYLGLTTGTLTVESIGNLTMCFFAFSYSFVNLLKARSGEQQLDRYFRLTWEVVQIISTAIVGVKLYHLRLTSISSIMEKNGELLRKTSARGAKYCNLSDSCIVFSINICVVAVVLALLLGIVPTVVQMALKMRDHARGKNQHKVFNSLRDISNQQSNASTFSTRTKSAQLIVSKSGSGKVPTDTSTGNMIEPVEDDGITSFERHCLGAPFTRMFNDCDDFAYTMHRGHRCSSVEAILLTGFLFYGKSVYPAQSVLLLLAARVIPRSLLRTFNILLLRWRVDPFTNSVDCPQICPWFMAASERVKLSAAVPLR